MKEIDWLEDKAIKESKRQLVYECVKSIVRNEELKRAEEKKIFKDGKRKIQYDHTDVNVMTVDEQIIYASIGKDTDKFIKARQDVIELQEECKNCIPINQIRKLSMTDRIHLTCLAYVKYSNCLFSESIFDPKQGGADLTNLIYDYNFNSSVKILKNDLRPILNRLFGSDGDYFYGVGIKKSDIPAIQYLRCFLTKFNVRFDANKNYKRKEVTWNNYKYRTKAEMNIQRKAFTEFLAVILNNVSEDSIRKPKDYYTQKVIRQIGILDLIVRCNIFKCMHEGHEIQNITAIVKVLLEDGREEDVQISAGYCQQCNVYFIMESTYQELKRKGIILCRVTDSKTYAKGGFMNGSKLAQESILMQYGYNVSQTVGLSARQRQKILAVMIDNKVLSKSEIISYLDFFIRQHGSRNNMGVAISKWEDDREFVEHYRSGEYTKFGVNAIYRR